MGFVDDIKDLIFGIIALISQFEPIVAFWRFGLTTLGVLTIKSTTSSSSYKKVIL